MSGIMITIDDAPHPASTTKLLAAFADFGLTVGWFVIGRNVNQYPDGLKAILNATQNHRIGNHSMDHPQPFCNLNEAAMVQEWEDCHKAVKDVIGFDMEILRTPGGAGWLSCPGTVAKSVADANASLGVGYKEIKGAGADDNPEPNWATIKQYADAGNLDNCHDWHVFLAEVDKAIANRLGDNIIFHDSATSPSAADFMVEILTHIKSKFGLVNFAV